MLGYINYDIKIDFRVPGTLSYLMEQCEESDKNDDLGTYTDMREALIGSFAKEACATGAITGTQWETIERRYG